MGKCIEMEACANVPKYVGLENTAFIELKEGCNWYGHAYGTCVGFIGNDGTVESYFKTDCENGTTEIFDKLREDIHLIEKHVHLVDRETMIEKKGRKCYIPYKVKNHSSNKPTITDAYVDRCSNVHYVVEYEILLVADEGFKRYITLSYETEGSFASIFFDQICDIEEMFEEWFQEGSHGFNTDEEGCKSVLFYDDTGEPWDVEFSSIRELLSTITSIRVIKCEREIMGRITKGDRHAEL